MAQAKDITIALVDISGYTRFLVSHKKAQEHAQMIVGALLEALIEGLDGCLEIAEIEGDAIFAYAVKQPGEDAQLAAVKRGECLLRLFRVFSATVQELGASAICKCPACTGIVDLRIKTIVHSGRAVISQLGRFTKLSGIDVIKAHRLLKNSVDADEYVLLTDEAKADVVFPDSIRFEQGEEHYDQLGTVHTHVARDVGGTIGAVGCPAPRGTSNVGYEILRHEIRTEYAEVAVAPDKGYHFHTGRRLAEMLEYPADVIDWMPARSLDSFAGTGNPHSAGEIPEGSNVVDIGCGSGFDTLVAARQVGPTGKVIGVDMTPEMVEAAREGVAASGVTNTEILEGYAEELPVADEWADVVISNGVFNLCPNKPAALREFYRVLKPGGRLQLGDILIQKALPESAKHDIDLWTG